MKKVIDMRYDKLVRDKIPEIIRQEGRLAVTRTASDDEYEQKLKEKLREEVDEFLTHGDVHELADIIEVIYAIGEVKKMEKHHLEFLRQKKAKERGVFSDKVILIETK